MMQGSWSCGIWWARINQYETTCLGVSWCFLVSWHEFPQRRMLQSSLKEALREADSGKPQAASTYISNCSMPEARMEAKSCIKRCIACCSVWSWNHARPQICHDGSVTVVCCWSRHSCSVGTGKWKRGTEGCPGQALFRGVIVPCWQSNLLSIGVSLTASMPLVLRRFERKRQNST